MKIKVEGENNMADQLNKKTYKNGIISKENMEDKNLSVLAHGQRTNMALFQQRPDGCVYSTLKRFLV